MKNLYLSYARDDAQRAAEVQRILQAQGYRPWLDTQGAFGSNWHHEMEAAIAAADALILLLTASAATSPAVTYDWAYALGAGVPVYAIIYESAPEHPRLSTVNRYDSRAFSDENHFWDHFLKDLNRQLERAEAEKKPAASVSNAAFEIDKSVMPSEPGYWLVMRRGPMQNQLFRLERPVINIGRDLANDIAIRDSQVSRYHLRLTLQGQEYYLQDLDSSNGTRINGVQMAERVLLNDGDLIALGESILLTYDLVYLD